MIAEKRSAGVRLLDLTISNPTQAFDDYPHSSIGAAYAGIQSFVYLPDPYGLHDARAAIAGYYADRGIPISPSALFLTSSTSEAYALLFKLLCNPGDEVLVPVPSYPLFEYLAALESVRVMPYRLFYDGSWSVDFESLQSRISKHTRAIIVVNPNNPTGSFLKKSEAEMLIALARERNIPIISDEVFAEYSFGNSADRIPTLFGQDLIGQNSVLVFALNGLSKLAGMPQMKLGWIAVSGAQDDVESARERLELILDTYLSVNTPVQIALPELLNIGTQIRHRIIDRTKQNLAALQDTLAGSAAHPLHTEGGWSATIQLPATSSEKAWVSRLLNNKNVIVQPGFFFDFPSEPYIIASLIARPEDFREGIGRLRETVGS